MTLRPPSDEQYERQMRRNRRLLRATWLVSGAVTLVGLALMLAGLWELIYWVALVAGVWVISGIVYAFAMWKQAQDDRPLIPPT